MSSIASDKSQFAASLEAHTAAIAGAAESSCKRNRRAARECQAAIRRARVAHSDAIERAKGDLDRILRSAWERRMADALSSGAVNDPDPSDDLAAGVDYSRALGFTMSAHDTMLAEIQATRDSTIEAALARCRREQEDSNISLLAAIRREIEDAIRCATEPRNGREDGVR